MSDNKGTGSRYPGVRRLPSGLFQARYWCDGCARHDGVKGQHSESFDKERAAHLWRTEKVASLTRGTHVDSGQKTQVADYAREYVQTLKYEKAATVRTMETHLRALEGQPLGSMLLVKVRTSDVRAWARDIENRYAPTTAAKRVAFLRAVFTSAVDDRLIATSPFTSNIRVAERRRDELVPLTVEQVTAYADVVPDRYRAVVYVLAGCGLRLGEGLGLLSVPQLRGGMDYEE